ncbi:MAG: hypothetical protein PUK59_02405 [Actinomycetaceae bacterium]|nr:hypothetical protein [Actinomycetaceae bacterium]
MEKESGITQSLERIAAALEELNDRLEELHEEEEFDDFPELLAANDWLQELDEHSVQDVEVLDSFLAERQMILTKLPEKNRYDLLFDRVSEMIGKYYDAVRPILDAIKANQSRGKAFTISLKGVRQRTITVQTKFCNFLYENSMLQEYVYRRSPINTIKVRPSTIGIVQSLLSGHWMERYVKLCIERVFREFSNADKASYEIFTNVAVRFPDGANFELDTLVFINEAVYWIECKSGEIGSYVRKYATISQDYKFDLSRTFVVLAEASAKQIHSIQKEYGINAVNLKDFPSTIRSVFVKELLPNLTM